MARHDFRRPLVVTCAYSSKPEFARWLRRTVNADSVLSRRIDLRVPLPGDDLKASLAETQVYAAIRFSPEEFAQAHRLEWLQLGLAGADSALFPAMRRSPVIVTTSVGVHDQTVPYSAWAFVLAFATGLHAGYVQKFVRTWDRKPIVLSRRFLSDQRILIVGTGRIGQRIARLAKQAGMNVWGIRRNLSKPKPRYFDRVLSPRGLHRALPSADYVVLITPGGEGTRNLIGAAELALMKPTAYLINMARGSVVDERALIAALRRKRIAGAGLDVFAVEPLPPGHPFYRLPNVAMTPHTAGDTADYPRRAGEFFLKNLRRYLAGRPLVNVVDKRLGY